MPMNGITNFFLTALKWWKLSTSTTHHPLYGYIRCYFTTLLMEELSVGQHAASHEIFWFRSLGALALYVSYVIPIPHSQTGVLRHGYWNGNSRLKSTKSQWATANRIWRKYFILLFYSIDPTCFLCTRLMPHASCRELLIASSRSLCLALYELSSYQLLDRGNSV